VLSLSLCFGFIQLTEGSYWSSLVYISKKSIQGSGGILNTGGNLGGVISTPLVPLLVAQYNWIIALSSGAIFAIAGIIFFLMIKFDNEETNVNE
jgi:dipeptide/tripeptide permease